MFCAIYNFKHLYKTADLEASIYILIHSLGEKGKMPNKPPKTYKQSFLTRWQSPSKIE